jgi:type IV secretory pathway TrbF-like protein
MAVALKDTALNKDTPAYTDRVIAWHNQRLWILTCSLLVLLAASIGDNIVYHLQPAPPPFVLKVNDRGDPVGQVLPVLSAQAIPDAFLRAQLADFIHDAFSVDRDPDEEDRIYSNAQRMVTGEAAAKLEAWYHRDHDSHHPKIIYVNTWIEASPTDTLKVGQDTYQVDYKVTTHEHNDLIQNTALWRATLHVIVGHSADPESLGLFVNDLDFEQVKQ